MTITTPTPQRVVDLAGSSIWLAGMGTLFTVIALGFVGTPWALGGIVLVAAAFAALLSSDITIIRTIRRIAVSFPPNTPEENTVKRRFKRVVIVEVAAIVVANITCTVLRLYDYMTPIDVFIVGLHFFPLAVIFRAPRHHLLAAGFCVVVVLTVLLVPQTAKVGHAPAWFVWISLGCGPVAILSGFGNLREARRHLRATVATQ